MSPRILSNVSQFKVLPFNNLFSDVHCGLHCELKATELIDNITYPVEEIKEDSRIKDNCDVKTTRWTEKNTKYVAGIINLETVDTIYNDMQKV